MPSALPSTSLNGPPRRGSRPVSGASSAASTPPRRSSVGPGISFNQNVFSEATIPELPTPALLSAATFEPSFNAGSASPDTGDYAPDVAPPIAAAKTRRASWFARRQSATPPERRRDSAFAPEDTQAGAALDPNAPALAPPLARRGSYLDFSRRTSQMWQMTIGDAEKPGFVRRGSSVVRSASITSLKGINTWIGAPSRRISVFEEDLDLHRHDIIEFIATVKSKNEKDAKHIPWLKRSRVFPPLYILTILCIIYFLFIGVPLWNGVAYSYWRYFKKSSNLKVGTAVFMGWAALQAYMPILFCRFEQNVDPVEERDSSEVALLIPAYKAAGLLGPTIEHALKIFTKSQIFIIANGNSPEPLDNTAEVCARYGVNHYWVPIGSKITAEFVGVAVASKFKYVMLIDDDVHLPTNLPIVTKRLNERTKCIGYTIKSTGADGIKGTYIQQCQDMEYKSSGLSRTWGGRFGSATFPHGAIILWEREALQSLFTSHPGYVISEDWYFGHCARRAGYRIEFCSQVFVETETPPCLLWDSIGGRGGYGEMTVWKQRFYRWNYFYLFRMWDDFKYILFNWRLGHLEFTAKFAVMVELVDSAMNLIRPFVFVTALILDYKLTLEYMGIIMLIYIGAFTIFNAWQLRLKNEMVSWKIMPTYFAMKFILLWFGAASMYYGLYHYIFYFSNKHPKVIENHQALEAAYNIRCGVELAPLADTLSEIIEQVEDVQQARDEEAEATAEIMVVESTPTSSVMDLEKGVLDPTAPTPPPPTQEPASGFFANFSMHQA